jgi:hypothetical protein
MLNACEWAVLDQRKALFDQVEILLRSYLFFSFGLGWAGWHGVGKKQWSCVCGGIKEYIVYYKVVVLLVGALRSLRPTFVLRFRPGGEG